MGRNTLDRKTSLRTPENNHHHLDGVFYPFSERILGGRHTSAVPDPSIKKPTGKGNQSESEKNALHPKLVLASDVKKQPIRWLWENKILRGSLSLITGLSGFQETAHLENADIEKLTKSISSSRIVLIFPHDSEGVEDHQKSYQHAYNPKDNVTARCLW